MTSRRVAGVSIVAFLLGALGVSAARAQPPGGGGDEDLPAVQLSDAGIQFLKLAVPRAEGDGEGAATQMLSRDMDITGLFQLLDPTSFPSQLQSEGLNFSSALWSQVGAQAVIKMKVSGGGLEGRVFVVARGDTAVLSKTYRAADLRDAVHEFANDVVKFFTGAAGVFGSRIALALTGGAAHEIAVIDMDGGRTSVVTKMASDSLLPAYSPSGAEIAFTSYARGNPDLWIVSAGGGRARRVSKQPGLNTGATWSRSGALALTMSFEGNSEIYKIDSNSGRIEARLTNNPAIDSSPCFSPDGSQIAFVSNRQGSPQIFIMSANGGDAKRLTFQGKYNQTPRFSPRTDKPQIAFTGRDERGVFDLFLLDLRSGKIDRLTQGHGSNLDPTWSPDGRLVAYVSSRGGLFVQNPETHHEVQVWKGSASSPSWGPTPRPAR
jgi:TolB protein